MNKILVFGGSFDPIHKGHLDVAFHARRDYGFDTVWFVPCVKSQYDKDLVDFDMRCRMIELAINDYGIPRFHLNLGEVDSDAEGRMYDLATYNRQRFPECEFHYLLGSDSLMTINSWYRAEELTSEFRFVIIPRKKDSISSTKVREQIKTVGGSEHLTKSVKKYIRRLNLYV